MEVLEIYHLGLRVYISSYYNILDSVSQALYLASYALRVVASLKITFAAQAHQTELENAWSIIENQTFFFKCPGEFNYKCTGQFHYREIRKIIFAAEDGYWLRGCMQKLCFIQRC